MFVVVVSLLDVEEWRYVPVDCVYCYLGLLYVIVS